MKRKLKRIGILIFLVLLLDDICRYITAFIEINDISIVHFGTFGSSITDSIFIVHKSIIYIMVLMAYYFVTHYFRKEKKQ